MLSNGYGNLHTIKSVNCMGWHLVIDTRRCLDAHRNRIHTNNCCRQNSLEDVAMVQHPDLSHQYCIQTNGIIHIHILMFRSYKRINYSNLTLHHSICVQLLFVSASGCALACSIRCCSLVCLTVRSVGAFGRWLVGAFHIKTTVSKTIHNN